MIKFIILGGLVSMLFISVFTQSCNKRDTEYGSVCVCNTKYCDTVPKLEVSDGKYQIYSSSKASLGFNSATGSFLTDAESQYNTINVNQTERYQIIIGFGGAFTDSAGINIKSLSEDAQEKLILSYFGEDGVEYSLCRVPMGGTDFSTRAYSYDDFEYDETLEKFALQEEDLLYKIPLIQKANELRNNQLKLFSSVWTAPKWMKTNNDWTGIGVLKSEYYQLWADYFLKFFEEYNKHNVSFWGLTTQNEPYDGFESPNSSHLNAMGWLPSQMNKWVGENLGPTIRSSEFKDIKIMLHDDARLTLPLLLPVLLNNLTMSYADGAALHWYTDFMTPLVFLKILQIDREGWFFISSEACNGYLRFGDDRVETPIEKGSWDRGAKYIKSILDHLEYGAGGWVDWNLALNETGGPNYIDNQVDAAILVNDTLQEFYKQPMFYALGHFSKFATPGSVRLKTVVDGDENNLRAMAFLRPDNLTALVIYNSGQSRKIQIEDNSSRFASITIEENSINTILYK